MAMPCSGAWSNRKSVRESGQGHMWGPVTAAQGRPGRPGPAQRAFAMRVNIGVCGTHGRGPPASTAPRSVVAGNGAFTSPARLATPDRTIRGEVFVADRLGLDLDSRTRRATAKGSVRFAARRIRVLSVPAASRRDAGQALPACWPSRPDRRHGTVPHRPVQSRGDGRRRCPGAAGHCTARSGRPGTCCRLAGDGVGKRPCGHGRTRVRDEAERRRTTRMLPCCSTFRLQATARGQAGDACTVATDPNQGRIGCCVNMARLYRNRWKLRRVGAGRCAPAPGTRLQAPFDNSWETSGEVPDCSGGESRD